MCPTDGSEWCCPGSYCRGISDFYDGVRCESCDFCSIEPKDSFNKDKCPSGCWIDDDFWPRCGCGKCANPETCDSTLGGESPCCGGYECQSGNCVSTDYRYGVDICWKVDNNDGDDFQPCFVNPYDACDGDIGYGCRPAVGNWLTAKFVNNPGYEYGPKICGPKCKEVVPIGAENFERLGNLNYTGWNDMWCYENVRSNLYCYVDYMAECQPDPSQGNHAYGLGYGNLCHPLPVEDWVNREITGPFCDLWTGKPVQKCDNLGWNAGPHQVNTINVSPIQCWGDQKGNFCESTCLENIHSDQNSHPTPGWTPSFRFASQVMSCCSDDCSYREYDQDHCKPIGADWTAVGSQSYNICWAENKEPCQETQPCKNKKEVDPSKCET